MSIFHKNRNFCLLEMGKIEYYIFAKCPKWKKKYFWSHKFIKIRILDEQISWKLNFQHFWKDCLELGQCKFVQNVIELVLYHLYQSCFLNFLNFKPNIFISKLEKDWNTNRFTLKFWFHYTSLKISFRVPSTYFHSSSPPGITSASVYLSSSDDLPLHHLIVSKMNLGN